VTILGQMQKRFVDSARTAVLYATGACILLSAIAVFNDYQKDTLDGASYASLWVVFWPLTFAGSLWYDVRRGLARQIIASARSPH
jgi:hypothetical protein